MGIFTVQLVPWEQKDDRPIISVIFFGDSLVGKSIKHHKFFHRMSELADKSIPTHRLIFNYLSPFGKIDKLAGMIDQKVVNQDQSSWDLKNPLPKNVYKTVYAILWDGDVADVHEEELSSKQKKELRDKFDKNLNYVLQVIDNAGSFAFVSGLLICSESSKFVQFYH